MPSTPSDASNIHTSASSSSSSSSSSLNLLRRKITHIYTHTHLQKSVCEGGWKKISFVELEFVPGGDWLLSRSALRASIMAMTPYDSGAGGDATFLMCGEGRKYCHTSACNTARCWCRCCGFTAKVLGNLFLGARNFWWRSIKLWGVKLVQTVFRDAQQTVWRPYPVPSKL